MQDRGTTGCQQIVDIIHYSFEKCVLLRCYCLNFQGLAAVKVFNNNLDYGIPCYDLPTTLLNRLVAKFFISDSRTSCYFYFINAVVKGWSSIFCHKTFLA